MGVRAYWKNVSFERLDEATIATIVAGATRMVSPRSGVDIHHLGGAFGRVPQDATAYPNRVARYWLNMYGVWDDPADDAERIAWARGFNAAMQAHASSGLSVPA